MSHDTSPPTPRVEKNAAKLRAHALSFPETHEDFPWGHSAFKVKGKVFCFLVADGKDLRLSLKLPESRDVALGLPDAAPTGYGLGRSGWVSMNNLPTKDFTLDLLSAFLEESYRAIAPKKLSGLLDSSKHSRADAEIPSKKASAKKPTKKKTTAKKAPAKDEPAKDEPAKDEPMKRRAPGKKAPLKRKAPTKKAPLKRKAPTKKAPLKRKAPRRR